MADRPLEQPKLVAIKEALDAGDLTVAQRLLAELDDSLRNHPGASYLAIRLLFERGKLDVDDVIGRLAELIQRQGSFMEAAQMLDAAQSGALKRLSTLIVPPSSTPAATIPSPHPSGFPPTAPPGATLRTPPTFSELPPSVPNIPRAPALPKFTPPPPGTSPSYVPDAPPTTVKEPWRSRASNRPLPREEPGATRRTSEPEIVNVPVGARSRPTVIRSGRPAQLDSNSVTLANVAAMLDEGGYAEALSALDQVTTEGGPELAMLRARALLGARRLVEATLAARKLGSAPLLDPQLRAGCARLLIELGEIPEALAQARRAHREEPRSPLVAQTLAWALVRAAWDGDMELLGQARSLLVTSDVDAGPARSLVTALRAEMEALAGDAERARDLAEQALSTDAHSVDAMAASALALARVGDAEAAKSAYARLVAANQAAARSMAQRLAEHRVKL
jgi:tetratricopeptide (TPR) repeat protein